MSDNLDYTTEEDALQQPKNSLLGDLINSAQAQPLDLKECREREEAGDADLFTDTYKDKVIFDHSANGWFIWRGNYWQRDRLGEVVAMVYRVAAEYIRAGADAAQAGNADEAKEFTKRGKLLMKRKRIVDVLWHTASKEGMRLTGEEWDTDPMILGVENGVIELTTGTFRAGNPGERIQSHSPAKWQGIDYPAPNFEKFILEIFNDDEEIARFVQRLFGYCLTGKTTERRLPILWGEGANGKTTLIEALSNVFGPDLAHSTQADSLMETKKNGAEANPFLYALKGKRVVFASESKEGQRINEGLVKQLTGQDTVTTRQLYSAVISFAPTFKPVLSTNHKPHVDAESIAMWDRLLLIPFTQRFVPEPKRAGERKRNGDLPAILAEEAPGILAWLVRGCLAWQQEGLNPPASVMTATEEYRSDEDTLGQFIDDCLLVGEGYTATIGSIYPKYTEWCSENGISNPMSKIALGRRLQKRFGEPTRTTQEKGIYSGVGVLQ